MDITGVGYVKCSGPESVWLIIGSYNGLKGKIISSIIFCIINNNFCDYLCTLSLFSLNFLLDMLPNLV